MIYTNENYRPPVTYCEPNKVEVQRMTKEEAKDILDYDIRQYIKQCEDATNEDFEALDLAVEALEEPTKAVTDCISRERAIEIVKRAETKEIAYLALINLEPKEIPTCDECRLPECLADKQDDWIPISEGLPECEQEVLICTEKKILGKDAYIDSIITPAMYEDGTMLEIASKWSWDDVVFDEWDDTEDCGIIPEGWWENRHFNPDEVYNNPVYRKVVAWMPLPEPYREGGKE